MLSEGTLLAGTGTPAGRIPSGCSAGRTLKSAAVEEAAQLEVGGQAAQTGCDLYWWRCKKMLEDALDIGWAMVFQRGGPRKGIRYRGRYLWWP